MVSAQGPKLDPAPGRLADAFPLTAEHLSVIDKSDDAIFYSAPRYVMHIDAEASAALKVL